MRATLKTCVFHPTVACARPLSMVNSGRVVVFPDSNTAARPCKACAKKALSGQVSPTYQEGSAFLRDLGFDNPAEIARILDIAMNPNSLFVTYRDKKRAVNGSARPLSVEADMRPVVDFLRAQGMEKKQLQTVLSEHPPVLSYSVATQLQPLVEYLVSVGIEDPADALTKRPSLLGLDVDKNLKKIVGYLQANDYSQADIITYITTTL